MQLTKGTIIRINERGFGFIRIAGHPDVFFHKRHLVGLLFSQMLIGRDVEFLVEKCDRGLRATGIRDIEQQEA